MLDLFKPLQILKSEYQNNPVCFTELGFKYNQKLDNLDDITTANIHRPFVIFYNEKDNYYYYLKSRGARKSNNELRKKHKGEVLIKHTNNGGYYYKDSYVDCSQIFKCNKELLESLIDVECNEYKKTLAIDEFDIYKILETINNSCNEIPPYLSIVEVNLDEKGNTYGNSLYLSNEKINELEEENDFFDSSINIEKYYSLPNCEFKKQRERYENSIEFIKMFQKEYFIQEYQNTDYDKKYYLPFGINKSKSQDRGR